MQEILFFECEKELVFLQYIYLLYVHARIFPLSLYFANRVYKQKCN